MFLVAITSDYSEAGSILEEAVVSTAYKAPPHLGTVSPGEMGLCCYSSLLQYNTMTQSYLQKNDFGFGSQRECPLWQRRHGSKRPEQGAEGSYLPHKHKAESEVGVE